MDNRKIPNFGRLLRTMIAVSPHLLRILRTTLLTCGPFDDIDSLRATFVDSRISHWRNAIPLAPSPVEQVDVTISFLSTRFNANRENALLLFLSVLAEGTDSNDGCYNELLAVAKKLNEEINSKPSITLYNSSGEEQFQEHTDIHIDRSKLLQLIKQYYNFAEFRDLCFELKVDYEDLAGSNKSSKVRELITYLERRNRLHDLVQIGRKMRPDIPWLSIAS